MGLLPGSIARAQVWVSPQGGSVSAAPSGSYSVDFEVHNDYSVDDDFTFSCDVSGPVTSCDAPGPTTIQRFSSVIVSVTYYTGATGGTGSVSLSAQAVISGDFGSGWYDVMVDSYGVSVTPDGGTSVPRVAFSSGYSETFTIQNTGITNDTYTITCGGTGPVTCTGTSATNVSVAGGGSTQVTAYYSTGAAGTGSLQLTASGTGVSDGGSYTVPINARPAVRAEIAARQHLGGTAGTQRFFVKNLQSGTATYTIAGVCAGTLTGCAVIPTSATLSSGESKVVTLTYTAGAGGTTGTGWVRATDNVTSLKDSGSVAVTSISSPSPVVSVVETNPGTAVERGLCLTVAAGASAAFQCGDLRIIHPLPAMRTLNKARVPTLLYNSALADPYPIVAASITLASGSPVPDSVEAILTVGGVQRAQARWAGSDWTAGATRRIALGYSAASDTTKVYDYTLEVATIYLPSGRNATSVAGKLIVVNRRGGGFGAGWWLAGLERLEFLSDSNRLWIGGDGSARLYTSAGTNVWVAANVDRPDTLTRSGTRYYRRLPGGVTVQFNSAGQHDTTVNRLGHKTAFTYTSGRLTSIKLPTQGGGQTYTFAYDGNNQLASVTAPGSRVASLWVSSLRVDSIRDPDNKAVKFSYESPSSKRISSRTDRRGTVTTYSYDAAEKIWRVKVDLQPDSIRFGFRAIDVIGLASATPKTATDTALAYTSMFGARQFETGSNYIVQETRFWLDRFGAPRRVVNAMSGETVVRREEGQWSALATEVQAPNGFLTRGRYDGRGNIVASVDVNPLGTGQDAVTRFHWDAKWDFADSVVTPTGRVTAIAYDALTGNRLWQQAGTDAARRVTFRYGNSLGLLSSTVMPQTPPDSLAYDAMGNLSIARTPKGYDARFTSDAQGRVTLAQTRLDTLSAVYQSTLADFDLLDRDTLQRSIGPALGAVAAETLYVRKFYNANGQPDSLWTWAGPDVANVDTIRTRWLYDRAGRTTYEIASDLHQEKWVRDDGGNVVADSTRQAHTITMAYDALNRLTTRSLPPVSYATRNSNISSPPQAPYPAYQISADIQTFTYNAVGALLTADNADAKVKRSYYLGGLLETDSAWIQTVAHDDWTRHVYGLHHTYDLEGRETSLAIPQQLGTTGLYSTSMSFAYDPQVGQLQSVTDLGGSQYAFAYNSRMELASLTYPADYAETFNYDADGRLAADTLRNTYDPTFPRLPALVWAMGYRYDARGNLTRSVNTAGFQDTLNLGYSGLGHLVSSKLSQHGYLIYSGDDDREVTTEGFTLDALGNRKDGGTGDSLFHNGTFYQSVGPSSSLSSYLSGTGRITQSGGTHFIYDSAGNTVFTYGPGEERATFYGADGSLRAADWRWSDIQNAYAKYAFEQYRYDALGRRILVWSKKSCVNEAHATFWWEVMECKTSLVRRTVWNGDQELAEIQMPGGDSANEVAVYENDTATVHLPSLYTAFRDTFPRDRNQYFGRVLYTPGRAIDQPIAVTRINYEYQHDDDLGWPIPWKVAGPITTMPFWNRNGDAPMGVFTDGSRLLCHPPTSPPPSDCVGVVWSYLWSAYDRRRGIFGENWFGTVLESKRDKSNLSYNRNRYYDPLTGRFTQEDPIGLAGGLNLYGFAKGDPVNFSDPFGDSTYVNCRPLQTGHRWEDTNFGHCAVRVSNSKLRFDFTFQLQPDKNGRTAVRIAVSGASDKLTTDFTQSWINVAVPKGMTSDRFDQLVLGAIVSYTSSSGRGSLHYDFLGEGNSNAFVYDVITEAGGRVPSAVYMRLGRRVPGICGGIVLEEGPNCSP
jgi:RHS repeat-associated protein